MKLSDGRENKTLKKLYCITTFNTPQYLIDTLEDIKTYHSHSTQAASTNTIPMSKCKKQITKKYFFHQLLDPGIHLILCVVKLTLNLNV